MKFRLHLILIVSTFFLLSCSEERPNKLEKRTTIEAILEEYQQCKENESSSFCKTFTARAICEYNGIEDLKENGEFIEYHNIYKKILKDDTWKNLGLATSQKALDNAQLMTNKGFPVVAININDKHKFSVLVLQGKQVKSIKWGLKVPSCAAFFPTNYKHSFINKTLNYAWKSPKGIQLWVRK